MHGDLWNDTKSAIGDTNQMAGQGLVEDHFAPSPHSSTFLVVPDFDSLSFWTPIILFPSFVHILVL